jgi:tetratricopeptide (TPR) repeat protein
MTAALDKAADLQNKQRFGEALAVLEQELERLGDSEPGDLRQQLENRRAALRLVARLDAIRLSAATRIEGKFDWGSSDRDYAAVFREAGLGQPGDKLKAVVDRIRDSAIRDQLVAALDNWALIVGRGPRRAWLLAVARQADPDPWRDRFRQPTVWQDRAALERLARKAKVVELSPHILGTLGMVMSSHGADAVPLLRTAQACHPDDFWLTFWSGIALGLAKKPAEATGYFRAALALRPKTSAVHDNLGNTLYEQSRWAEALACYRRALALDPNNAGTHLRLGNALKAQGRRDEASACYQKALDLNPKLAVAHNNLGLSLQEKGRVEQAIVCYRKALDLNPELLQAHYNLGNALKDKGRLDEAIVCYRKALVLDPKFAPTCNNLGNALKDKGQLDEAIVCYQKALALDRRLTPAHYNLGLALHQKGRLGEASACYRKAIVLDPGHAYAHGNLGQVLMLQGRFAEARASTRRCLDLLPQRHTLHQSMSQQMAKCEHLLALDNKLPAILKGEAQPVSADEQTEYGRLCMLKKLYHASARFWTAAFTADPKLAGDLKTGHRYDAACTAALIGNGQGKDAAGLSIPGRARWRQQALAWLRADLARWTTILEMGTPQARAAVQQTLQHWQRDPDLASIREAAWLVNLPDNELQPCRQLWAEVEALLKRAGEQK